MESPGSNNCSDVFDRIPPSAGKASSQIGTIRSLRIVTLRKVLSRQQLHDSKTVAAPSRSRSNPIGLLETRLIIADEEGDMESSCLFREWSPIGALGCQRFFLIPPLKETELASRHRTLPSLAPQKTPIRLVLLAMPSMIEGIVQQTERQLAHRLGPSGAWESPGDHHQHRQAAAPLPVHATASVAASPQLSGDWYPSISRRD